MSNEYKTVPVEPTAAMVNAALVSDGIVPRYYAMLEAAPQPPALGGEPDARKSFDDWLKKDLGLDERVNTTFIGGAREPWRAWEACSNVYRAHLAPLQAEIERLKDNVRWKAVADEQMKVIGQLKAESKSALESLNELYVSRRDAAIVLRKEVEKLTAENTALRAAGDVCAAAIPHLDSARQERDQLKARNAELEAKLAIYEAFPGYLIDHCEGFPVYEESLQHWLACHIAALSKPAGSECCTPTAEEKALLAAGDYTPEELWGGSKPTCPKCIGRAGAEQASGATASDVDSYWRRAKEQAGSKQP